MILLTYLNTAAAQAIHELEQEVNTLRTERDRYRAALEMYANDGNWCHDTSDIGRTLAKEALGL